MSYSRLPQLSVPLVGVLVAAKVPIAPVPHAERAGAHALEPGLGAVHAAAVVPLLLGVALQVALGAVGGLADEARARLARRQGVGQRAARGDGLRIDDAHQRRGERRADAGRQPVRGRDPDRELVRLRGADAGVGGIGLRRPQVVREAVAAHVEALRILLPEPARRHADVGARVAELDPSGELQRLGGAADLGRRVVALHELQAAVGDRVGARAAVDDAGAVGARLELAERQLDGDARHADERRRIAVDEGVEDAHEGLAGVRVEADLVVEPVAVGAGERDARAQRSLLQHAHVGRPLRLAAPFAGHEHAADRAVQRALRRRPVAARRAARSACAARGSAARRCRRRYPRRPSSPSAACRGDRAVRARRAGGVAGWAAARPACRPAASGSSRPATCSGRGSGPAAVHRCRRAR